MLSGVHQFRIQTTEVPRRRRRLVDTLLDQTGRRIERTQSAQNIQSREKCQMEVRLENIKANSRPRWGFETKQPRQLNTDDQTFQRNSLHVQICTDISILFVTFA